MHFMLYILINILLRNLPEFLPNLKKAYRMTTLMNNFVLNTEKHIVTNYF